MNCQISVTLSYRAEDKGTIILNIRPLQYKKEQLLIDPANITWSEHIFPSRKIVISIAEACSMQINYTAEVTNSYSSIDFAYSEPILVSELPADVISFLNPSRYCESDKLSRFATHLVGELPNEFEQVMAITEWINKNVEYISGSSTGETTACDIITQRAGVCRDFAHLGVALCRALNIPARYCSVYAFKLQPQDFHACFEVYLAGYWVVFDATKLAPLNGFIKIAHGLDAADTAVSGLFGKVNGEGMEVSCTSTDMDVVPVFYEVGGTVGICYS